MHKKTFQEEPVVFFHFQLRENVIKWKLVKENLAFLSRL